MSKLNKNESSKGEKTMLISLLLSAPGPIATGIPAITSYSATQIADFFRRTADLVALFVAWWIYRKLQRNKDDDVYRIHMERMADLTVAGAMMCSAIAMLIVGVSLIFVYKSNGNVIIGLIIAVLGLLVNTWFWWRYRSLAKERFDSVIEGQLKLYRAKASVDLCVVIALSSVAIAPNHPVSKYIDALGCIMVAFYLLYNGVDIMRKNKLTLKNNLSNISKRCYITKNQGGRLMINNITPEDAKERLDSEKGITLLDVRTKDEYDAGHIEESILIPVDKLKEEAESKLTDKDAPLFIYCRSGNRSTAAAKILVDLGYKDVYNLGGINKWPYKIVR